MFHHGISGGKTSAPLLIGNLYESKVRRLRFGIRHGGVWKTNIFKNGLVWHPRTWWSSPCRTVTSYWQLILVGVAPSNTPSTISWHLQVVGPKALSATLVWTSLHLCLAYAQLTWNIFAWTQKGHGFRIHQVESCGLDRCFCTKVSHKTGKGAQSPTLKRDYPSSSKETSHPKNDASCSGSHWYIIDIKNTAKKLDSIATFKFTFGNLGYRSLEAQQNPFRNEQLRASNTFAVCPLVPSIPCPVTTQEQLVSAHLAR